MSNTEIKSYSYQEPGGEGKEIQVAVTEAFFSPVNRSPFFHGKLDGRDVTIKFSSTGYSDNEYNGLSILYANGVCVPQPIALIERDEEPKTGIIMARIFGETLDQVPSALNRLSLGKEVRKTNEIAVSGFGLIINGIPEFKQEAEFVESTFLKMMPYIQNHKDEANLLLELWRQVKSDRTEREPRFAHRDIKDKNVIVSQSCHITLIDLEYWNGADPMWDVGGYLFYVLRTNRPESDFREFMQGYTNGQESVDHQKLRILFYSLLSAGRFVELVSRIDPNNIAYAVKSMSITSDFVRNKLQ